MRHTPGVFATLLAAFVVALPTPGHLHVRARTTTSITLEQTVASLPDADQVQEDAGRGVTPAGDNDGGNAADEASASGNSTLSSDR